jgi:hypothetical protein
MDSFRFAEGNHRFCNEARSKSLQVRDPGPGPGRSRSGHYECYQEGSKTAAQATSTLLCKAAAAQGLEIAPCFGDKRTVLGNP